MDDMGSELLAAQQRVQTATAATSRARRRLASAEEAVVAARRDLDAAISEEKTATSALDALIPKMMKAALRKGGRASVAIAEVMIRQLAGDQGEPAPDAGAAGASGN